MKKTTVAAITCIATLTVGLSASIKSIGTSIFDWKDTITIPIEPPTAFDWLESISFADFNQDGFDDILLWTVHPNQGQVLINLSGKGFEQVFVISDDDLSGISYYRMLPGDINGDGFPDLVAISYSGNTVLGLINTLGPGYACAADLTGDGSVEVNDLLFVVAEWGECE